HAQSVLFMCRMLAGQSRWPSVWRLLFALASVAWTVALPLATWSAAHVAPTPSVSALVGAVYGLGTVVCHQLTSRSFHLWGMQMPVCARCTGIYAGSTLGAIASIVRRVSRTHAVAAHSARPTHPTYPAHPTYLVFGAALPTIATIAFEWITGHTP